MGKLVKICLVGTLLVFTAVQASGKEDAEKNIRDRLTDMLPDYEVSGVHETPVPGVYEVLLGSELVYVSGDGRYMMQGRLIDLETRLNPLKKQKPEVGEFVS